MSKFPELTGRSECCDGSLSYAESWRTIRLVWCKTCGSLWAQHDIDTKLDKNPWKVDGVDQPYIALENRRRQQARTIVRRYSKALRAGPVLDYGAGQAVFLSVLLDSGIDAYGCDLAKPSDFNEVGPERYRPLSQPWSLPDGKYHTIALLDVIEHHPRPSEFIERISRSSCRQLLIKVPLLDGPISLLARVFMAIKIRSIMEKLLLVGEVSPHYAFYSKKGLRSLFERFGWRYVNHLKLAEVGFELPARLNMTNGRRRNLFLRSSLRIVGMGLGGLAPVWADTGVFLFERPQSEPPVSDPAPEVNN